MAEQITIVVPDGTMRRLRAFGKLVKATSPEGVLRDFAIAAGDSVKNELLVAMCEDNKRGGGYDRYN